MLTVKANKGQELDWPQKALGGIVKKGKQKQTQKKKKLLQEKKHINGEVL